MEKQLKYLLTDRDSNPRIPRSTPTVSFRALLTERQLLTIQISELFFVPTKIYSLQKNYGARFATFLSFNLLLLLLGT